MLALLELAPVAARDLVRYEGPPAFVKLLALLQAALRRWVCLLVA